MLKVMQPLMPSSDDILPYLRRIDEARIYTNFGPLHEELSTRLADYFGVTPDQIVLMSNATVALQASIELLIESGSDVGLPAWTFTATAAAVIAAGMKPKFLDVDNDWRVLLNDENPLLVDVLPFGAGLREDNQPQVRTVIDGAASFDALRNCGKNLRDDCILVVSMHATKLLGAGEGAVCIIKNKAWAERLKAWSNFGFELSSRLSETKGSNAKLSEFAAAIALASLDRWVETRKRLWDVRKRAFEISTSYNFRLAPPMRNEYISPYWIVEFESGKEKEELVRVLSQNKIESREWWAKGCHQMNAYSQYSNVKLEHTDILAERSLGLPFHAFMNDHDFEKLERVFRSL
jgi:dTDP-4-amino-4,6-dideoxygalactose transaminase